MKKVMCILLVVAGILALAAAGGAGYIWYRNNHVFVEGDAYPISAETIDLREKDISPSYYDQLQRQLPGCAIAWNVPFRGGKLPNDTRELKVTALTEKDIMLLRYFPDLETLHVEQTDTDTDYGQLAQIQDQYPDVDVVYQVSLGGSERYPLDTKELVLENGMYTLDDLSRNLQYLPQVETVTLKKVDAIPYELESAYPELTFAYTVELMGQEYDAETTQLDLSGLKPEETVAVGEKLPMLPNLEEVELMDENGESQLSVDNVKTLKAAAPEVSFRYSFDFFGERISTTDEEVYVKNKSIGEEGLDQVRQALDLMENCDRFVLENCKIPNEAMAQLREEYRDKTKVVWRVYFGDGGSCLTDREIIKAVYGLKDSNCHDLVYCEDAKYCDFGHNETLNTCEFVSGMPNLEAIILSGSPIKDLEAFRNCKKLKFLEIAFCGYIKDVSPLAECESLEMLNISATKVTDLSPVYELPMTLLSAKNLKLTDEDKAAFEEKHPECWTSFQHEGDSVQPYGQGWRYDENNKYLPYYEMLRSPEIFHYDVIMNTTRW